MKTIYVWALLTTDINEEQMLIEHKLHNQANIQKLNKSLDRETSKFYKQNNQKWVICYQIEWRHAKNQKSANFSYQFFFRSEVKQF